jgi:hypothetical protein
MSSTARGTTRNENDYYVTPHWLIREFLEVFIPEHNIDVTAATLDPAAGGCELYEASYPTILKEFGFDNLASFDIRTDSKAGHIGIDFLALKDFEDSNLIITNPPFDCSTEFTEKALKNVVENGHVVMLQRLNWLGSKKRQPFWDNAPLKHIYVHSKRAGFYPDKPSKKDSIEYAHFVFKKGYIGKPTLSII